MRDKKIVILGTGGTIAGVSHDAASPINYTAAKVGIAQLAQAAGQLVRDIETEQVAQIDSKDMSFAVWTALASRVQHHLARPDVQGVVITHGTDTLEETAYFLQCVLGPAKPVVLTCAMRPANALAPDGPQNIQDAVVVAQQPGAQGVVVVCAGTVHNARDVQKTHTYQLAAFSSGDAGAMGYIEDNRLRLVKSWPKADKNAAGDATNNVATLHQCSSWPWVDIVLNYAGVTGTAVDALVTAGVQGLVVAGTGNGTVHQALESALVKAQAQGVLVVRATRCTQGQVFARADDKFPTADGLSPVKARVRMLLQLLGVRV